MVINVLKDYFALEEGSEPNKAVFPNYDRHILVCLDYFHSSDESIYQRRKPSPSALRSIYSKAIA